KTYFFETCIFYDKKNVILYLSTCVCVCVYSIYKLYIYILIIVCLIYTCGLKQNFQSSHIAWKNISSKPRNRSQQMKTTNISFNIKVEIKEFFKKKNLS